MRTSETLQHRAWRDTTKTEETLMDFKKINNNKKRSLSEMPDMGMEDARSQIWLQGWEARGGQPDAGLGVRRDKAKLVGPQREGAVAGADCFAGSERLATHRVRDLYRPELVLSHAAGRGEVGGREPVKLGPGQHSFGEHSTPKQTRSPQLVQRLLDRFVSVLVEMRFVQELGGWQACLYVQRSEAEDNIYRKMGREGNESFALLP